MLYIFIRETLAARTLRQSYITANHGRRRLRFGPGRYVTLLCGIGWSRFGGSIDGRRLLRTGFAAVKDMVESWDWIATFDTDGHTTFAKTSS